MARPNVVRSQPFSASMGNWKKPMAERGPKVSAAIRQPQMMISHGTDLAAPDLAADEAWVCVWAVMLHSPGKLFYPIGLPAQNQ